MISTWSNKHIKAFFQKNKHITHKAFDEKNKHVKNFDCRQWKIKPMNKHMKGLTCPKHVRKNQGFSEIKLNDNASQTACLHSFFL